MRLKLVSYSHDTLLGHIDVPNHWQEWLDKGGACSTAMTANLPMKWLKEAIADEYQIAMPEIQTVTVARVYHSRYRDAVAIIKGSIEEFERLPGCSFSPSMAYLRSQLGNPA